MLLNKKGAHTMANERTPEFEKKVADQEHNTFKTPELEA